MNLPRLFAVIPAAGSGVRMGLGRPKQHLMLGRRSLLEHAVEALWLEPRIERIVVVVGAANADATAAAALERRGDGRVQVAAAGGASRAESVRNGLRALAGIAAAGDYVLVHDAARPCLAGDELARLIAVALDDPVGALLALPVGETVKRAHEGRVAETLDRAGLWRAATPQMFRHGILLRALESAAELAQITDESAAIERLGLAPRLVAGSSTNIKVTLPADLALAEAILRLQDRW